MSFLAILGWFVGTPLASLEVPVDAIVNDSHATRCKRIRSTLQMNLANWQHPGAFPLWTCASGSIFVDDKMVHSFHTPSGHEANFNEC